MEYWDLNSFEIKYCLLTHPHLDHAGGAQSVKQKGLKIVSAKETAGVVTKGDELCVGYLYYKKFMAFKVNKIVSDEEILELIGIRIEIIYLHGHSMGCAVIYSALKIKEL